LKENSLPIVLFSGALSTSRLVYSSMLQSIAAAGYLVISIDHPYDADIVEFPDGASVKGVDIETDADIELAIATRVQDITFVHRQLSNHSIAKTIAPGLNRGPGGSNLKTAALGHSLGGAAAAAAMLAIPSIRGGVNLDGSMLGPVLQVGLDRPFMLMGHENKTQETDPSWKAIWPALTGWKREFEVKGTAHYSYSDLPLVTETLGLQELLPEEVGQILGTVKGSRMMNITVSYVTAFLDHVLKGKSDDMLDDSNAFPEVILRDE
jgi:pimeloyl-ACP methyl ester carboxylesterase